MIDLNTLAGHLIRRLHQSSVAVYQREVQAAGSDVTSVQFAAMAALAASPGLDQARLAEMIACDRATMGGVITRLQKKGYLDRQVSKADRRARTLSLTPAGQAALQDLQPVVTALQRQILGKLEDDEAETLLRLLAKATG